MSNKFVNGQPATEMFYTPTRNAHELPSCNGRSLSLSPFFLSMGFVYGCVRACLDSRGCWRLVARLGWVPSRRTDMGAPRESGYYRQTLIWSRPGLPSNFRALTRPLTRLSVNAPKRRDAFSTPAFYRHGELHGLRVRPTGTSRTRLLFRL